MVVDRGMAYAENLAAIRARGLHYLVAARQPEREPWLAAFAAEDGWADMPRTPGQHKTRVEIKQRRQGDEVVVLCWSEGREAKDQAIRDRHEARLRAALARLQRRIATGRLKAAGKIQQAIGRLRERPPRVARSYAITYGEAQGQLTWAENAAGKTAAATLDGGYLLKTDRQDLTADEIWRTYILLTRVEAAFRAMKSPLLERPIFHQLQHRVEPHIFLCVLAYHLLVDPPPRAEHPPSRHRGGADVQREDPQDPQGRDPRRAAAGDLPTARRPRIDHMREMVPAPKQCEREYAGCFPVPPLPPRHRDCLAATPGQIPHRCGPQFPIFEQIRRSLLKHDIEHLGDLPDAA